MTVATDPWSAYRARIKAVRWVLVAGVAAAVGAVYLWSMISVAVLIAWLLLLAIFATRAEMSPCPRCGKAFFRAGAFHNLFAKRCLHCQLPKWADVGHADASDVASESG